MSLLAECLISFGLCLAASAAFSLPASFSLIREHKDKTGYVGFSAVALGVALAFVGAALHP